MYASVHTDRSGRVFVSDDHPAAGTDGSDVIPFGDAIALPPGSELLPLSRDAVALDRSGKPRPLARGRLALGAILPPGYVRALVPAYRDEPTATPLTPLAYAAVAAGERGEIVASAIALPATRAAASVDGAGTAPVRAHPASSLARQLARCSKENACAAAQAGLGRGTLPIPLGAPAAERPRLPVALRSGYSATVRESAAFRPRAAEVAEVALDHIARGGTAVAFGRACDGEPLAVVRVVEEATAAIRERAPWAAVHLETSGSDPAALRRAIDAGVGGITIRIASARPDTYEALHGPLRHRWTDVRASLQLAAEKSVPLTVALLTLPGLTDADAEIDATVALLGELPGGHVELRDLGADPARTIAGLPKRRALGMRAFLARLAQADHFDVAAPGAAVAAGA